LSRQALDKLDQCPGKNFIGMKVFHRLQDLAGNRVRTLLMKRKYENFWDKGYNGCCQYDLYRNEWDICMEFEDGTQCEVGGIKSLYFNESSSATSPTLPTIVAPHIANDTPITTSPPISSVISVAVLLTASIVPIVTPSPSTNIVPSVVKPVESDDVPVTPNRSNIEVVVCDACPSLQSTAILPRPASPITLPTGYAEDLPEPLELHCLNEASVIANSKSKEATDSLLVPVFSDLTCSPANLAWAQYGLKSSSSPPTKRACQKGEMGKELPVLSLLGSGIVDKIEWRTRGDVEHLSHQFSLLLTSSPIMDISANEPPSFTLQIGKILVALSVTYSTGDVAYLLEQPTSNNRFVLLMMSALNIVQIYRQQ
jgi:hypothetical protein